MSVQIDQLVRRSLGGFLKHVQEVAWMGRENEAVNLFVFGFLLERSDSMREALAPTQIGIEVAAADAPNKGARAQVRKDLVIWPQPGVNRWYPGRPGDNKPLAILEWKVRRPGARTQPGASHDLNWLLDYSTSSARSDFVGYCVFLDLAMTPATISVTRVAKGRSEPFSIPA